MIENFIEKVKTNKKEFINVMLAVFFVILALMFFINFLTNQTNTSQKLNSMKEIQIFSGNSTRKVNVEIAKTAQEQAKGLMYRQYLEENSGMLFIFDSYSIQSFWMKNTLIPLDIIFFDIDGNFVNMHEASPCPESEINCPTYASKGPAKYVLEVNQGWFKDRGLYNSNTKLDIKNI